MMKLDNNRLIGLRSFDIYLPMIRVICRIKLFVGSINGSMISFEALKELL